MKPFIFLALTMSCFLSGCQPPGKAPEAEKSGDKIAPEGGDYLIVPGVRVGPLHGEHALENDLVQTFGAENIKKQAIYVGEGEEMPGYLIFPDTKDELQIAYDTTIAKDKPAFIRVEQEGTHWKTSTGISIGTTIEELVKINGHDFDFLGFEWDYGGFVTDWKNGKLNTDLRIRLGKDGGNLPTELIGDRTLSSNNPKIKGQKIKVASLDFSL